MIYFTTFFIILIKLLSVKEIYSISSDTSTTIITDIYKAVDLWFLNPTEAESNYGHISNWDTSKITNMSYLFSVKRNPLSNNFNDNINNWNLSLCKNMEYMFYSSPSFNQPLDKWNVSNVENMKGIFANTSVFNQNLESWDMSSIKNMAGMLSGAYSFNQKMGSLYKNECKKNNVNDNENDENDENNSQLQLEFSAKFSSTKFAHNRYMVGINSPKDLKILEVHEASQDILDYVAPYLPTLELGVGIDVNGDIRKVYFSLEENGTDYVIHSIEISNNKSENFIKNEYRYEERSNIQMKNINNNDENSFNNIFNIENNFTGYYRYIYNSLENKYQHDSIYYRIPKIKVDNSMKNFLQKWINRNFIFPEEQWLDTHYNSNVTYIALSTITDSLTLYISSSFYFYAREDEVVVIEGIPF